MTPGTHVRRSDNSEQGIYMGTDTRGLKLLCRSRDRRVVQVPQCVRLIRLWRKSQNMITA